MGEISHPKIIEGEKIMAEYRAFDPKVEINGKTVMSALDAVWNKKVALEILARHGIQNIKPNSWYPMQSFLNVLREISGEFGDRELLAVGRKIPFWADFPKIKNLHDGLSKIDIAYHNNHRGGEIGHYRYTKLAENKGRMICDNPYPCRFDQGIFHGLAENFDIKDLKITHREISLCRRYGNILCDYILEWETEASSQS